MSLRKKRLAQLNTGTDHQEHYKPGTILASPDNPLIIIIVTLIIFGIMAVFSAGAPEGAEVYNNSAYYALKHIFFMGIGLIFLLWAANFDYRKWQYIAVPFAIITLILIGATYIPGLGRTSLGASRWLVGLPVQPSELAKISSIILISAALADSKTLFCKKMIINTGLVLAMILLILKQPNLSISMLITFVTGALMVVGGVSSVLLGITTACVGPVIYSHILSTPYQLKRITGWINPWADAQGTGYNLIQSWYAIGSGGILGAGFGNSKQKLFWLPFRHTDFIFSVIAEEFGLIGSVILIGLFSAFIHRGFVIANRCSDVFGRYVAFGITFSIGLQALINMGVATGVLPVTGVTLPLISYGGSSVVVTMTMLGILLNISRKRIRRIQPHETKYEH